MECTCRSTGDGDCYCYDSGPYCGCQECQDEARRGRVEMQGTVDE